MRDLNHSDDAGYKIKVLRGGTYVLTTKGEFPADTNQAFHLLEIFLVRISKRAVDNIYNPLSVPDLSVPDCIYK